MGSSGSDQSRIIPPSHLLHLQLISHLAAFAVRLKCAPLGGGGGGGVRVSTCQWYIDQIITVVL